MRIFCTLFLTLLLASCSSDNNEGFDAQGELDLIVGDWIIIESGGAFDNGEEFSETNPCSNAHTYSFHEDGLFDSELRWEESGICSLDMIRQGEWLKTSRSDYPDTNYRIIFYANPGINDRSVGYAKITFTNNTMKIESEDINNESTFSYLYKTYRRQ